MADDQAEWQEFLEEQVRALGAYMENLVAELKEETRLARQEMREIRDRLPKAGYTHEDLVRWPTWKAVEALLAEDGTRTTEDLIGLLPGIHFPTGTTNVRGIVAQYRRHARRRLGLLP
ncbi:MAG: hypothetical protein OXL97_12475 [Chloroflexota bacterium]|nr:hypothetical protein [Chloroflexota bacterium]MDE2884814.1 hypothetical protein [Chloroflexota bacterium]